MRQSEAWILQAKSDLAAAQAVLKEDDPSTYCQALAKYQQVTEKSVKGMIAALNELGIPQVTISGRHSLEHEINGLDALRRKRPNLDSSSIELIDRIMRRYKAGIIGLCSLAPRLPGGGMAYPRNTEYPFNDASQGGWTAPAASDAYTHEDVGRAREVAWPLHHQATRFASSLRRRRE